MRSSRDLLDDPIIGERYFFPRRDAVESPLVVTTAGIELCCHLTPGDPLMLHFHGNGEVVADWVPELSSSLSAAGVGSLFGEYRGYGASSGQPAIASMLDDALAIAAAAGDAGRVVVYGRSVGSIFALHVAAHLPVAGLIIESGIADVRERLLLRVRADELGVSPEELDDAIAEHLDHRAKIEAFDGPVLIFHAAGDDLVPPHHAQMLAAWAGERATLRLFPRGDHNTIFAYNGADIVNAAAAFVHRSTAASEG